jgi:hypothetical protein
MQYLTGKHNEHQYYKHVEVEEGKEYQYKFRLGEGDWWVLNEESPIGTSTSTGRDSPPSSPAHANQILTTSNYSN